MRDNARPLAARTVTQYLPDVEMAALAWPANSPGANRIEHLWDMKS